MEINKADFIESYILETRENIASLEDFIVLFNSEPKNQEILNSLLRVLHTMKGAARMMSFHDIEQITHALENLFKQIENNKLFISPQIMQLVFEICIILRKCVENIESHEDDKIENVAYILKNIDFATAGEDFSIDFQEKSNNSQDSDDDFNTDLEETQSIRVNISKIDEIIQSLDKLVTREFRLKNDIGHVEKNLLAESKEYAGIIQVFRHIHEDINLLEQQVFSIQEQIIALRMLPLDMILQPFRRSIMSEALNLEKNVKIDIPVSNISLDKTILENLPNILLHLVRNALDHGIESSKERAEAGKDDMATISVHTKQVSNRIIITVKDDGKGIDCEKIREKAIKLYPTRIDEINKMDEKSLQQFLFVSGFSTKDKVSELSGRGVGLDVVRTEMDRMKGKIKIDSILGKGTSIELSLPLSLATQDGLFVLCGEKKYLIPSHYISEIINSQNDSIISLQGSKYLPIRNELLQVYDTSIILGETRKKTQKQHSISVVIIEYLEKRIGLIVDKILHYNTVVLKPLPPLLKNFKSVQGVVFDENYAIIPILHIPDLMHRLRVLRDYEIKNFEVKNKEKEYSILVVDDSHTTRQIEKIILEAEGYRVVTACDGIEALERLKQNKFDLVITDIKMPRMDGFVLINNIRRNEDYNNISIIVISSVFENDINEKIFELGAQGYIVKSDFQRGNLVSKVKELLHG